MTTPQAMKAVSSQQGRTPSQLPVATPPVSTPFSNPAATAFSPRGPRSSPQAYRKSPANSSTLAGQQGSQNGALNFDSPSTAAAMRALDMGNGFGFGLDNVNLGGLDGLAVFSGDDDKVKRLDQILKILDHKGFVSEAGIARLAQRSGLELITEESTALDGRKTRTLVIAGSILALDIVLDNNIVQSISLAFHESPPSVTSHAPTAGKILLDDLQLRPDQSPLTKTLENFAHNFEKLAELDKLSIIPGLNCQEALAGIYVSLDRLHDYDIAQLRKIDGNSNKNKEELSRTALSVSNGRPVMHAHGRVGLALQYWEDRRHGARQSSATEERIWSISLGCAAIENVGLPPVRVSENWVPKDVVKEDSSSEPESVTIDWQDPEITILPLSEESKDAAMDFVQPDLSTARVPRVMFTATFDPPVVLPQNEWAQLYALVAIEPPAVGISEFPRPSMPTYDSLFFPLAPGSKADTSEARTIIRQQEVTIFSPTEGTSSKITHVNRLYIYKPIYGQIITDIPFSHPQQLIEMLPILRQYAFLSRLLESSFSTKDTRGPAASNNPNMDGLTAESSTSMSKANLDAFLAEAEPFREPQLSESESSGFKLDVILTVHPSPQLQIVFPFGPQGAPASITVQVLPGGKVKVMNENILKNVSEEARGKMKNLSRENLGKALEHFENLGTWAEWIRTRLA